MNLFCLEHILGDRQHQFPYTSFSAMKRAALDTFNALSGFTALPPRLTNRVHVNPMSILGIVQERNSSRI